MLSHEDFLRSFELAPRLAICVQVRGANGEVLLARRSSSMEVMPGVWHYPGAFLLLGETFGGCIDRIVRKELGASVVGEPRQVGCYEDLDGDPRGHVVDLVFEVELASPPRVTDESETVSYFDGIPEGVAFHHDQILRAAGLRDR